MSAAPLAYFLSWTCYGHWLHGDERGSVDPAHNAFGEPWLAPDADAGRHRSEHEVMTQAPYELDAPCRAVVLAVIRDVCGHRGWTLHAVHVRARHVHVVVSGDSPPERMMNDFKSYASRALNERGFDARDRKRWTRHGSTRYVWEERYLAAAIAYALEKQGTPMERYPEPEPRPSGSRPERSH
jgi:REP element-mobilizing transposase RayT